MFDRPHDPEHGCIFTVARHARLLRLLRDIFLWCGSVQKRAREREERDARLNLREVGGGRLEGRRSRRRSLTCKDCSQSKAGSAPPAGAAGVGLCCFFGDECAGHRAEGGGGRSFSQTLVLIPPFIIEGHEN